MRKLLFMILGIIGALGAGIALSACGGGHEHVWNDGEVTKAATCTEDGVLTYTCDGCGETYTETIDASGHQWNDGEVTTAATCAEDGVLTYTCVNCGETYTETIDALGHRWNDGEIVKAATCTEGGIVTYTCANGGETYTETISALGHHWDGGAVTTTATCTEDGVLTYTCADCGETYTETIEASGHQWDDGEVTTAATCTEDGVLTYTCANCGETHTETIEASGHRWDDGVVTKAATYTEAGIITYTCENGGETDTQFIHFTADYTQDFGKAGGWKYGYTANYQYDTNLFTFVAGTLSGDAYVRDNDGGIELKSDWINTNGGNAVLGYTFDGSGDFEACLTFTGDNEEETRVIVRMVLLSADGVVKQFYFFGDGQGQRAWTAQGAFSVTEGDTLYFVFNNEGAGYATGKIACTLTAHYSKGWQVSADGAAHEKICSLCGKTIFTAEHRWERTEVAESGVVTYACADCGHTKYTLFSTLADFVKDFTAETQSGAWKYGSVVYTWGESESFTFTQSETFVGDEWTADGVEIKAGWINAGNMTAISYTAERAVTTTVSLQFRGGTENTRLALRVAVKDGEGNLYGAPAFIANNGDNTLVYTATLALNAGDTIYFIFSNENAGDPDAYPNGGLTITLAEEGELAQGEDAILKEENESR